MNKGLLSEAVQRGIISNEQSRALGNLVNEYKESADGLSGPQDLQVTSEDEPFRLLKGFRDIFIAIGIAILAAGIISTASTSFFSFASQHDFGLRNIYGSFFPDMLVQLAGIAVTVAISEWVTRKQRLPMSGLVLAVVFSYFCGMFVATLVLDVFPAAFTNDDAVQLFQSVFAIGALLGMAGYYWRYRLPFALFPMAGAAALIAVNQVNMESSPWVPVLIGLAIFALAMWYDMKDRYRVQRFSECAFWLHLLAAPFLVHGIIYLVADMFSGDGIKYMASAPNILLAVIVFIALLAIVTDRRAFLVSALFYLGYAIFALIKQAELPTGSQTATTMIILGVVVLVLGAAWATIRRAVVNTIVPAAMREKLPPAH